jgi:aminopeptidase N
MPFSSPRTKVLAILLLLAAVVAAAAIVLIVSNRSSGALAEDDPGTGDSLFPHIGTLTYDVDHYAIDLTYQDDGSIRARTTITARARDLLASFALDFVGLEVDDVTVDGIRADAATAKEKLTITPETPVERDFTTVVDYHGTPKTYEDPDGSSEGWIPTDDGATVMSQPVGAMSWFPNNNTPTDKATFDIELTVPDDLEAASNGVLASKRPGKDGTTWVWEQSVPMVPYLAMISIGQYRVFESSMTLADGRTLPIWSFIDPSFGPLEKKRAMLEESIRVGERLYGPYPAASAGLIVEKVGVDYALETQDRAVYDGAPDAVTIMHETAHQWVGNSAGLEDWGDIWINEGFATHAEWTWTAEHGGISLAKSFTKTYDEHDADDKFWKLPPADLGAAENLFSEPTYYRGAMTLEELRQRIGDADFASLRTAWPTRNQGRTATTKDFIALAEKISGDELGSFFETWLYEPGRPALGS